MQTVTPRELPTAHTPKRPLSQHQGKTKTKAKQNKKAITNNKKNKKPVVDRASGGIPLTSTLWVPVTSILWPPSGLCACLAASSRASSHVARVGWPCFCIPAFPQDSPNSPTRFLSSAYSLSQPLLPPRLASEHTCADLEERQV